MRWSGGCKFLLGVPALALVVISGCQSSPAPTPSFATSPALHSWFPISAGTPHSIGSQLADGVVVCQSCHAADAVSFTDFTCVGCHAHEENITDRLHLIVPSYLFSDSKGCYSCHSSAKRTPFDHAGVSSNCAVCHDVGAPFAALPKVSFKHPATGGVDCGGCHNTTRWDRATGAPNANDPAHDILVAAQLPTYVATSIVNLTAQTEKLSMVMNHGSGDALVAVTRDCVGCHPNSDRVGFFPGAFHASLPALGLAQPTSCSSCHIDAMPTGFVGATASNPKRTPSSGEMRHEAVAWKNDAPTGTSLVSTDCGLCHRPPSGATPATWSNGKTTATVQYHASLTAATVPQPASCLDCHANSRPRDNLTSTNTTLPAGVTFDHATATDALEDCGSCHTASSSAWSSWRAGRFHLAGGANPPTCLPCHAGERPTTTAAWSSSSYKSSPFDYVTNAAASTHGDGQDCVACHAGPGTGAWGGSQTWAGGQFSHGADTHAAESCIVCHSTQRPDLQRETSAAAVARKLGFDHATNGTGECIGCHAATVAAGRYVDYTNPATHDLPGGDWAGGVSYPGSTLSSSVDQFISVTETKLTRDGTTANRVLSMTTVTDTIYNGMSHVSTVLPAVLSAGPTNAPDNTKCWHCHTNTNGTVTAFSNGQFHSALTSYRATPGGPVVPFPQPSGQCKDCHSAMVPDGIVLLKGSNLWPMDHSAVLATPIMIGTATIAKVADVDCSFCHKSPGVTWADGVFHAGLPSTAVVADCNGCHYPVIADGAVADTVNGTSYAMSHLSNQVLDQKCQPCHAMGVAQRAQLPAVAKLFQTGTFHSSTAAQPKACLDCHMPSQPAANLPTQSTWSYQLRAGGTATNQGQWMNHGSNLVAGKDCASCHLADAQTTGSTWSHSALLHSFAPQARTCQECHGRTNGGGAIAGTRNNLPAGLTDSMVVTSASAASGIPAGTPSQMSHGDINVLSRDCGSCHTQVGVSISPGIQGKEWAQARFHANFTTNATSLVMNGTTGRCSNCHLNVNPRPSYAAFSHAGFAATPGTQDCSACHAYPGTGTGGSPNWLGAAVPSK